MPDLDQLLEAAANAKREGREEDFQVLMGVYRKKTAQSEGPTFRTPEDVPYPDVVPVGTRVGEARQKVEQEAFKLTPEQEAEAIRKAEEEARRKEGALVSPGGRVDVPRLPEEEPGFIESALEAIPEALQTAYKFYKPEAKEDIREVFKRQALMTPEAVKEAEERAKVEGKPLVENLPDAIRLSVKGVETPLGATLRGISSPFTGAVEYVAREALTYDVDPATGEPLDPEDYSYKAEQKLREVLGDEDYPTSLSTGGLLTLGPAGKLLADKGWIDPQGVNKVLRDAGVPESLAGYLSEGITVPSFGPIDYGAGAAPDVAELDPYGLRKADTRLDWSDQIIRNARVDRSLKDLYVDMPDVRKAYKDTYGSESAAFYGGILADMFVPDATMLAGPIAKGAKVAGKAVDVGLTGVAAGRLYGSKAALKALKEGATATGEAMNSAVAKVVAREATAPRAIMDAINIEGDVAEAISKLPTEVLESSSGQWMVKRIAEGVDAAEAFAEVRIAQNLGDVVRVFDGAIAKGKSLDEARSLALGAAKAAIRAEGSVVPAPIVDAIRAADSTKALTKAVNEVVPESAAGIRLRAPGAGAARNTLNLADDAMESVGYADAVAKVEESVRKTLGELVPRDMVAVTSKVMVPRDLAGTLRALVDRDLKGVIEVTGDALRVADDAKTRVIEALNRVYPENIRSEYWDGVIDAISRGDNLAPASVSRVTDAIQTDAYLRLAPQAGRASAERLANIGKELNRATGSAFIRGLSGNLASRTAGAFFGRAKGVPGAYAAMGKRIGQETFGIPKRVADSVRAAAKAGDPDPFRRVGDDLAALAEEVGMGDNFVEEAWNNALGPLYAQFAPRVRELAKTDRGLEALLKNPPSLQALEEVDGILVKEFGSDAMGVTKDFASALLSGLVEAEAWVTARKVALEVLQDTPGLAVSMSPGLRGFPADEIPSLVSKAMADIMEQGTTRARDPNWLRSIEAGEAPYQEVLDAVGSSLRAMGIHYLDGVSADDVAARLIGGITPQGYEIPGVTLLRPVDLERVMNPESAKALAEGVDVLKRAKDEGKSLLQYLTEGVEYGEQFTRSASELLLGSNLVNAGTNLLSLPIAVMAREGLNSAIGMTTRAAIPRKDGVLFTAGGRPWTRAAVNTEAARLGVEASTRLSASRRGRLAADLMADIEQNVRGNPAMRAGTLATQTLESAGRIVPDLVDAAEKRFRYLGFEEGLRRGMTPEAAAAYSRDLLFDFEPVALQGVSRALIPLITKGVEAGAAVRALVERPQEAVRIMRASRARQDYNERTYGGDQPLLEPIPGFKPMGPAAMAWLVGTLADAYYGKSEVLKKAAGSLNPVKAAEALIGDLSSFLGGDEGETPDEMLSVMLFASMADRMGGKAGAAAGWDALVERYGLVPTNVTKDGVLPEAMVQGISPTRMGAPPRGGEPVPLAYKMSAEGRKQFKDDWKRIEGLSLGTLPYILQAWQDTGMAPEVRVPPPSEPATELYRQAAQETGRLR